MTADPPDTLSPAADTGDRLTALAPHLGYRTTAPDGDAGWVRLDDVDTHGHLDRAGAELLARWDRGDVAGSWLGSRLGGALVGRTTAAVVLDGRCPALTPGTVWLRLADEAVVDEVALLAPTVAVLAGDRVAGHPDTVVLDDDRSLARWWAAQVVPAVAPVLAGVRSRLPFGTRGLWGALADRVGSAATAVDRLRGGTGQRGWDRAELLLDALAEQASVPLTVPEHLPVPWRGGEAVFSGKGTCCLWYRTQPGPDPETGEGYCSTCPLVDPACRPPRLRQLLAGEARP